MRSDDGGANRSRLLRPSSDDNSGKSGVSVREGHLVQGEAEPFGGDLRLHGSGTYAHLVRSDLDGGVAQLRQRDPRCATRHTEVGIGGGRAAHADQPLALPARAGPGASFTPAEPVSSCPVGLDDVTRGEGHARDRILLRLIALAELDRVDAELFGEFVDCGLERESAHGLAGRSHESIRKHVHLRRYYFKFEAAGCIDA